MKKVTIQDVAEELSLSRNTVAKALANSDVVAYDTKLQVLKKAYEMGYSKLSPLILSEYKIKDLKKQVKTVVVLAKKEHNAYWNRIIMGISDELNKNNCKLQFNFISMEDERNGVLPLDMETEVTGIILVSVFQQEYIDLIAETGVPIVFLDGPANSSRIVDIGDVVIFDGFHSVKALTLHLIQQNIKKIAYVGDITYCGAMIERYNGYFSAMKVSGLEIDERLLIVRPVPNHYYSTEEVKEAIARLPYMPEAFVCANDDIAIELMFILKERGLIIGKDVFVTGFDDKEEARYLLPALSTVATCNQRLGQRLVQLLLWRVENPDMPNEIIKIHSNVVIRESSIRV